MGTLYKLGSARLNQSRSTNIDHCMALPHYLHAELAGQHGGDVADEPRHDLHERRRVLDDDVRGDLPSAVRDVDVELE